MSATSPVPPGHAYDLPMSRCGHWLTQARSVWRTNFLFFLVLSLLVVVLRRLLDSLTHDFLILVSYFSDALIFAWVFMGLRDRADPRAWSLARSGWQALRGRFFRVFKTGLWGIPAAITSYLIFLLAPQVAQVLVVLQGNALAATMVLFLALFVGGWMSLLLCMLPVLAAIQMARDPSATLQSSGLWAYRGVRAGVRPLTALFVVFVLASLGCSFVTTYLVGHLPVDVFSDWSVELLLQTLSESPLTLMVVMNGFLALLFPVANDLLRSADIDLSDEVFSEADKTTQGDAFWVMLLQRAGLGLRGISVMAVVFLSVYAAFSGYEEAVAWLGYALLAYLVGGSFLKSAQAWREGLSWSLRYRFIIMPVLLLLLVGLGAMVAGSLDGPAADGTP